MRTFLTATMAIGILTATTAPLAAQPEVKPGPEHELLKASEGKWDATIKMMGGESKGTNTGKLGLNGLWLLDEFKADFGGAPFEGRGATSYDPSKKKYVNIWFDSWSTRPTITEGTYDKEKKTLTLTGTMPSPDGSDQKVKMVTVYNDADTRTFTVNSVGPDGKDVEMLQITYKRAK
jgi:Protein of unknown function (DUF1579)